MRGEAEQDKGRRHWLRQGRGTGRDAGARSWDTEGREGLDGAEGLELSQAPFTAGTLTLTSKPSPSFATPSGHWFPSYQQQVSGKRQKGCTPASEGRGGRCHSGGALAGAAGGRGWGVGESREQAAWDCGGGTEDQQLPQSQEGPLGVCQPRRTHWGESSNRDRPGRLLSPSQAHRSSAGITGVSVTQGSSPWTPSFSSDWGHTGP